MAANGENCIGHFAIRLAMAVSLAIFPLMMGVAPGAAQNPFEPYVVGRNDSAVSNAHYVSQKAVTLQNELNGYTCVDPIAYGRLKGEVNDLVRAMDKAERDLKALLARDSKVLFGLSAAAATFSNYDFPDRLRHQLDDARDNVKADNAALDELQSSLSGLLAAYSRLQLCPPETIFRTSGKPPAQRVVGGGMYERRTPGMSADGNSGVRFLVGVEGGFGGARAHYDDLSIDPRSFIAGASVGVRAYQPNDMFLGGQVSVIATDLTKEAVPGLSVGLRWAVPVDVQVGRTFQTGSTPVSVYGFVGPMWGETRVSTATATDYFTLFGATAGLGVDVQVNQNWSVGAKARAFTLGATDHRSDGQHVEGGSFTINASYQF